MLIYSFITDYQAFSLQYKDNTTRDKNETKVGKQSANLGKNNEPIQNRLSFLIDCKSVILHHLAILSFPMVRPAWDNWWMPTGLYLSEAFSASSVSGRLPVRWSKYSRPNRMTFAFPFLRTRADVYGWAPSFTVFIASRADRFATFSVLR